MIYLQFIKSLLQRHKCVLLIKMYQNIKWSWRRYHLGTSRQIFIHQILLPGHYHTSLYGLGCFHSFMIHSLSLKEDDHGLLKSVRTLLGLASFVCIQQLLVISINQQMAWLPLCFPSSFWGQISVTFELSHSLRKDLIMITQISNLNTECKKTKICC